MREDGLSFQESYEIAYARGCRIGRIRASREIAIRLISRNGKPSKALIHKINREVDTRILMRVLSLSFREPPIAVDSLGEMYDELVPDKEDYDDICEDYAE